MYNLAASLDREHLELADRQDLCQLFAKDLYRYYKAGGYFDQSWTGVENLFGEFPDSGIRHIHDISQTVDFVKKKINGEIEPGAKFKLILEFEKNSGPDLQNRQGNAQIRAKLI